MTLFLSYAVVTALTIIANAVAVAVDLRPARFVLANSARLGIPRSWLPPLAAAKALGAAGLLVGLLGVHPVGIAAASGLVLFFTGALIAHLRARALTTLHYPGSYWLLAVASLALTLAQLQ